jgi:small-conductance mechanosensitive channel
MATREQINKLLKSLKSIESKLDVLVRLQKASMPKPKIGEEEKKIRKLCDKKHTIDDMVEETKKTRTNVTSILTNLRKKGLIRSVKLKDKLVYERI